MKLIAISIILLSLYPSYSQASSDIQCGALQEAPEYFEESSYLLKQTEPEQLIKIDVVDEATIETIKNIAGLNTSRISKVCFKGCESQTRENDHFVCEKWSEVVFSMEDSAIGPF